MTAVIYTRKKAFMKIVKFILVLLGLSLLAAGCQKVQLRQETPASPAASYQELPK